VTRRPHWLTDELKSQVARASEAGRRLKRVNLSSGGIVSFVFVLNVLSVVFFESGQFPDQLPMVWLIAFWAELGFWVSYAALLWLRNRLAESRNALFSTALLVVGGSHVVRSTVRELGYLEVGLTPEFQLFDRLLGDLSLTIFFVMGVAYVQAALKDLGEQERLAAEARASVIAQEIETRDAVTNLEHDLRTRIDKAVLAPLDQIAKLVTSAKGWRQEQASKKIYSLIQNEVRPLSHSLWSQLQPEAIAEARTPGTNRSRFPRRINPSRDLRAGVIFVLAGTNIFATTPQLSSLGYAFVFTTLLLCFPVLGFVITKLLPSHWSLDLGLGLPVVVFLALLAWLPALVFLRLSEELYPQLALLGTTSSTIIIATTIMTAIWSAYKADRLEYIAEIERLNAELSRLNSLKVQSAWVARRAWTHLMHGDVQSALTIAFARLQAKFEIDSATLELVADDIERARLALVAGVQSPANWRTTFAEIKATWAGVCTLSCETSAGAERLFDANQTAAVCAAEIVKELVSNAYRHGQAGEVKVTFSLDDSQDLKVVASNDGKPLASDFSPGVGFGMISELTNGWAFRNKGKRVHFEALVPVAASS